MPEAHWLESASPAFRLMIATSWLAPDSWQSNQEEAIRGAIAAGPDWTEYLNLVDRHRTPALSWAALQRVAGLEIPEQAKLELQKRSDACRMQAVRHSLLLAQVLKAFHRAGIPVMMMKGPILSIELYGDVGLRQSHDLDIACALEDIPKSQTLLENSGWRHDSAWFPLSPRQWESLLRHEQEIQFIDSQSTTLLELHWRNPWDLPGHYSECWERSIPTIWQGCTHQEMDPIDKVLYLCNHGGIHAWFRAKWLGDMARIHATGHVDWEAALERGRSMSQERPLLACLQLLHIAHGLPLPSLQGKPWENLPAFLLDSPLHALKDSKDPVAPGFWDVVGILRRLTRYKRLVLRGRTWRESLSEIAYCREDFRVLPLPDSLFWAYAPLRPILSIWRKIRRIWAR